MRGNFRRRYAARAGRKAGGDSDGEFLWLVSLSDLMILLFVFFVVLYSFAYRKLGAEDFSKIARSFSGGAASVNASPLDDMQKKLLKWVTDRNLLESVDVSRKEDALILEIKEQLLFASADYRLKGVEAKELVSQLSLALEQIPAPYRIGIEGHTDDNALAKQSAIRDNWELSVRRAHSVLHALEMQDEQKRRTVILGYGEMRPLEPNRDEKGKPIAANQAKNRRVTIRIF